MLGVLGGIPIHTLDLVAVKVAEETAVVSLTVVLSGSSRTIISRSGVDGSLVELIYLGRAVANKGNVDSVSCGSSLPVMWHLHPKLWVLFAIGHRESVKKHDPLNANHRKDSIVERQGLGKVVRSNGDVAQAARVFGTFRHVGEGKKEWGRSLVIVCMAVLVVFLVSVGHIFYFLLLFLSKCCEVLFRAPSLWCLSLAHSSKRVCWMCSGGSAAFNMGTMGYWRAHVTRVGV